MTTTEQKLRAIGRLKVRDITYSVLCDISEWEAKSFHEGIDSLTEKQVERINAIFARHFED